MPPQLHLVEGQFHEVRFEGRHHRRSGGPTSLQQVRVLLSSTRRRRQLQRRRDRSTVEIVPKAPPLQLAPCRNVAVYDAAGALKLDDGDVVLIAVESTGAAAIAEGNMADGDDGEGGEEDEDCEETAGGGTDLCCFLCSAALSCS